MSNSRSHPMVTRSDFPPRRSEKRKVFILRLWARGKDEPVWIGEIQEVSTGKISHVQGLEALFDWLRQNTGQDLESSATKETSLILKDVLLEK